VSLPHRLVGDPRCQQNWERYLKDDAALIARVKAIEDRWAAQENAFRQATGVSGAFADGATIHSFTIGLDGVYVIDGGATFAFTGGTRRGLRITASGLGTLKATMTPATGNDTQHSISRVRFLPAGATVALTTSHDAGGSQNHNSTSLTAAWLHP
jgi:hypothetical protein